MHGVDSKRELILESARSLFSKYGIQKTTMSQIADDINVSQPSLYYYFPDKNSLVFAVIEKMSTEYFEILEHKLKNVTVIDDAFYLIVSSRLEYLRDHFMIHMHLHDFMRDGGQLKQLCERSSDRYMQRETDILAGVIEQAAQRGELAAIDSREISEMYLSVITGISMWLLSKNHSTLIPRYEVFEETSTKQKKVTAIFLKGIKK